MDLYYYTKVVADGISRDLMSYEEGIWQPGLSSDLTEKHTIHIG
jgi:hypothetical protein